MAKYEHEITGIVIEFATRMVTISVKRQKKDKFSALSEVIPTRLRMYDCLGNLAPSALLPLRIWVGRSGSC